MFSIGRWVETAVVWSTFLGSPGISLVVEEKPLKSSASRPLGQINESVADSTIGASGPEWDLHENCEPSRRNLTVLTFQKLYAEVWAQRVERAISGVGEPIYLTVGESRTLPLFRNWLAHARNMSATFEQKTVVANVALDTLGFEGCSRAKLEFQNSLLQVLCIDLGGWLPQVFFSTGSGDAEGYGSCAYNVIIWTKPHILNSAMLANPFGVLMIDTDVVLYKPVLRYARDSMDSNSNLTIVTGREQGAGGGFWGLNSGTVWVTRRTSKALMDLWLSYDANAVNDPHGDQGALQSIFKERWFREPWHRQGFHRQLFKMPNEIVGQCAVKGEYATHYNCYGSKMTPLKRNGDYDAEAVEGRRMAGSSTILRPSVGISVGFQVGAKTQAMRAGGDWLLD